MPHDILDIIVGGLVTLVGWLIRLAFIRMLTHHDALARKIEKLLVDKAATDVEAGIDIKERKSHD